MCSHLVAGVRAGTVSATNPTPPPADISLSLRKFRDGDTVRVKGGPLRGHVGVVMWFFYHKYTVRLQDGSECSLQSLYFERTSLRCV